MSADLPVAAALERTHTVRVQAIFHVSDEQQGQAVASRLVDRAHEIANLPDCECDLDVSVEMSPAGSSPPAGSGGALPRGHAPQS